MPAKITAGFSAPAYGRHYLRTQPVHRTATIIRVAINESHSAQSVTATEDEAGTTAVEFVFVAWHPMEAASCPGRVLAVRSTVYVTAYATSINRASGLLLSLRTLAKRDAAALLFAA